MNPTSTTATAAQIMQGPLAPSELLPTTLMVAVAMLMGAVNFVGKVMRGAARVVNIAELIGEIFISGMCGLTALWFFRGFGVNEYLSGAGVAVAGHMGTRAIFLAERVLETWLEQHGLIGPETKTGPGQKSSEEK